MTDAAATARRVRPAAACWPRPADLVAAARRRLSPRAPRRAEAAAASHASATEPFWGAHQAGIADAGSRPHAISPRST